MNSMETEAYAYGATSLGLFWGFGLVSEGRSGEVALLSVLGLAGLLCLLYGVILTYLRKRQEREQEAWRASVRRRGRPAPLDFSARTSRARLSARQRCPYCHDALHAGELLDCRGCRATLHAECAAELGSCPTLGCGGSHDREGSDLALELRLRREERRVA